MRVLDRKPLTSVSTSHTRSSLLHRDGLACNTGTTTLGGGVEHVSEVQMYGNRFRISHDLVLGIVGLHQALPDRHLLVPAHRFSILSRAAIFSFKTQTVQAKHTAPGLPPARAKHTAPACHVVALVGVGGTAG